MKIGDSIRAARKNASLTQKQLANLCGVATITIRQYENSSRVPNIETIKKIAEALNVSTSLLIGCVSEADKKLHEIAVVFPDALVIKDGETVTIPIITSDEGRERVLLKLFHKLNEVGQHIAIQRMDDLTITPEYQKEKELPRPKQADHNSNK